MRKLSTSGEAKQSCADLAEVTGNSPMCPLRGERIYSRDLPSAAPRLEGAAAEGKSRKRGFSPLHRAAGVRSAPAELPEARASRHWLRWQP